MVPPGSTWEEREELIEKNYLINIINISHIKILLPLLLLHLP